MTDIKKPRFPFVPRPDEFRPAQFDDDIEGVCGECERKKKLHRGGYCRDCWAKCHD